MSELLLGRGFGEARLLAALDAAGYAVEPGPGADDDWTYLDTQEGALAAPACDSGRRAPAARGSCFSDGETRGGRRVRRGRAAARGASPAAPGSRGRPIARAVVHARRSSQAGPPPATAATVAGPRGVVGSARGSRSAARPRPRPHRQRDGEAAREAESWRRRCVTSRLRVAPGDHFAAGSARVGLAPPGASTPEALRSPPATPSRRGGQRSSAARRSRWRQRRRHPRRPRPEYLHDLRVATRGPVRRCACTGA